VVCAEGVGWEDAPAAVLVEIIFRIPDDTDIDGAVKPVLDGLEAVG